MSTRTLASFAVAILLGLISLLIVRSYLASHSDERGARNPAAATPVVIAVAPISRGAELKPAMFKLAAYPAESVPQGAFTTVADVMRSTDGVARTAVRDMVTNEPVVASKLSGPDSKLNLAGALQPGMRAVSLKSSEVAGVGGFALPGDRVDVLLTRQIGSGKDTTSVLQVLAENVRVMGVDQSSDTDKPTVSKAVTVEVAPEQAQAISLAQAVGEITLALREANDATPLSRRAMTVRDLGPTGAPAGPAVKRLTVARAPGATIRVTRGVEVATYNFN